MNSSASFEFKLFFNIRVPYGLKYKVTDEQSNTIYEAEMILDFEI